MKYRIVADSSCNLFDLDVDYKSVPLKILTDVKEYVDNKDLNVNRMLDDFKDYKGKSSTSCPSTGEWLEAFGDADIVFGVTITSGLSGSFNAAMMAKRQYEEMYPEKRVYIVDSLSAGPEVTLIVNKLAELIKEEKDYSYIRNAIIDYTRNTHLMFSLSSLENFSRNGRISPTLAKSANVFGIRVVGKASYEGKLEPTGFCRGQKKAIKRLTEEMRNAGYKGGKVIIAHTNNNEAADHLCHLLKETYNNINIKIMNNAGLCSYYAETGGILVGFEA